MDFSFELYREHLEEGAFLYDQRGALLADPELAWDDLDDFEQRLDAHVDALVVGGEFALEVCGERAAAGDPGELHTAVRVFCRQDRFDLLMDCIQRLCTGDKEPLRAIRNALNHELPGHWAQQVEAILDEGSEVSMAVFAKVVGYRRLSMVGPLMDALKKSGEQMLHPVIWALGRIRGLQSGNAIMAYLSHADPPVCTEAAFSLLRMSNGLQASQWLDRIRVQDGRILSIGLGGQRGMIGTVLKQIERGRANNDCPIALGMLGDIAAVEPLIDLMAHEEMAHSSALALNMILGADLYEKVFLPDEMDADELFDDEHDTSEGDNAAKPAGTTVDMLIKRPDEWRQWWKANGTKFHPDICYRQGQPYSPQSLLEILKDSRSPRMLRNIAYEELVIRYGLDIAFETDMTVREQKAAVAQYEGLIAQRQQEFKPGRWYFGGRMIS
jgi:uncharacterized protein (TIGR02270 family)